MTAADVLVLNVGSSTVKAQVVGPDGERRSDQEVEGGPDDDLLAEVLEQAGPVDAVGHRLVHGGPDRFHPALVTDELLVELDGVVGLAPLHLPPALAVVRAVRRLRPELPAVACFDTAFHADLPLEAQVEAVPASWRERGLRRYGYHGLSHAYLARRVGELTGRPVAELRTVSCHLGAGASMCAVAGGRSVETTMGFSPLSGLVMATRPGDLDPGALLWLLRDGVPLDELEDELWHGSGLRALTGRTGDMRQVLTGVDHGDEACALAFATYVHRARAALAAMVAALGGVDVVAFTGGVGERSGRVRAAILDGLEFLGPVLDPDANAGVDQLPGGADAVVSPPGAPVAVAVVHAREDEEIARQVRTVI